MLCAQEEDERAELEQRLRKREEERRLLSLRATELEVKLEQSYGEGAEKEEAIAGAFREVPRNES